MKIMPKNPLFLFISIFTPWRFWNTFIDLEDDRIILSRHFAETNKTMIKNQTVIYINDILEIGFPNDLKINKIEKTQFGAYGVYASQEIDFKTKSGFVALNARPYTKRQIRSLIQCVSTINKEIVIGRQLTLVLL